MLKFVCVCVCAFQVLNRKNFDFQHIWKNWFQFVSMHILLFKMGEKETSRNCENVWTVWNWNDKMTTWINHSMTFIWPLTNCRIRTETKEEISFKWKFHSIFVDKKCSHSAQTKWKEVKIVWVQFFNEILISLNLLNLWNRIISLLFSSARSSPVLCILMKPTRPTFERCRRALVTFHHFENVLLRTARKESKKEICISGAEQTWEWHKKKERQIKRQKRKTVLLCVCRSTTVNDTAIERSCDNFRWTENRKRHFNWKMPFSRCYFNFSLVRISSDVASSNFLSIHFRKNYIRSHSWMPEFYAKWKLEFEFKWIRFEWISWLTLKNQRRNADVRRREKFIFFSFFEKIICINLLIFVCFNVCVRIIKYTN